jgi:hypothetical protein
LAGTGAVIGDLVALSDWRRRVSDLYHEVRAASDPATAWRTWRAGRDDLFARHPQSPLPEGKRAGFRGIEGYGGGVYLPFADATSGATSYGGGRYLLDTVKGADLGMEEGRLVLDFNFAYNPSCAYDPRWTCPLPPPANRLPVDVRAGERVA